MPRHTNPNPIIRDYLCPDTLTQSGVQKGLIRETFSVPYTTAAPYLCTNTHLIRGQKYLTQDTHTHTHTHKHTHTHTHTHTHPRPRTHSHTHTHASHTRTHHTPARITHTHT